MSGIPLVCTLLNSSGKDYMSFDLCRNELPIEVHLQPSGAKPAELNRDWVPLSIYDSEERETFEVLAKIDDLASHLKQPPDVIRDHCQKNQFNQLFIQHKSDQVKTTVERLHPIFHQKSAEYKKSELWKRTSQAVEYAVNNHLKLRQGGMNHYIHSSESGKAINYFAPKPHQSNELMFINFTQSQKTLDPVVGKGRTSTARYSVDLSGDSMVRASRLRDGDMIKLAEEMGMMGEVYGTKPPFWFYKHGNKEKFAFFAKEHSTLDKWEQKSASYSPEDLEEIHQLIAKELIGQLAECHSKQKHTPIVLRDIKEENIFLDIDDKSKSVYTRFFDFDQAYYIDDEGEREEYGGTPVYTAPELHKIYCNVFRIAQSELSDKDKYLRAQKHLKEAASLLSEKQDVWALGLVLLRKLVPNADKELIPWVVKADNIDFVEKSLGSLTPDWLKSHLTHWNDENHVHHLLYCMLKPDPEERISAKEASQIANRILTAKTWKLHADTRQERIR